MLWFAPLNGWFVSGALRFHHETDDWSVFAVLAEEQPQLHSVLEELDGLAASVESPFRYEERQLASALNALEPTVRPDADPFGRS